MICGGDAQRHAAVNLPLTTAKCIIQKTEGMGCLWTFLFEVPTLYFHDSTIYPSMCVGSESRET